MRIKYVENATVRIVEPYQWDAGNDYTVDVIEPNDALHLLTHPPGDFKVAPDEPLLALEGMTEARAGELVLHGITNVAGLGALDEAQTAELATAMGVSGDEMRAWVAGASPLVAESGAAGGVPAVATLEPENAGEPGVQQ